MTRLSSELPLASAISIALIALAAVALDRLLVLALDRTLARRKAQASDIGAFESFLTRLGVLRRLARAAIYLVAASAVLSHFAWLRALSAGLWASAGIAGLVVGMAAKGTLGNAIAGVTLAFSQPFRVGDGITVRSDYGVVEDITLIYTYIRTLDNRRLVIPNDVLSTEVLYNHTIVEARLLASVRFWVSYGAELDLALKALLEVVASSPALLREAGPPDASIGEAGQAAVRLDVSGWAASQAKAWELQADVRRRGLAALRTLGALPKQLPVA
ncbi:MAG: mechanosensitive ion channel family protein [Myxococcales bacterium]